MKINYGLVCIGIFFMLGTNFLGTITYISPDAMFITAGIWVAIGAKQ